MVKKDIFWAVKKFWSKKIPSQSVFSFAKSIANQKIFDNKADENSEIFLNFRFFFKILFSFLFTFNYKIHIIYSASHIIIYAIFFYKINKKYRFYKWKWIKISKILKKFRKKLRKFRKKITNLEKNRENIEKFVKVRSLRDIFVTNFYVSQAVGPPSPIGEVSNIL